MLGRWVLDLVDDSDATHVEFVEVFHGIFFLIMRK